MGSDSGLETQHANNKVLRFEPAAASGCVGFNPFEEIRIGTEYEVGDAQNLATLIVDPDGKGLQDHWQVHRSNIDRRMHHSLALQSKTKG